MTWPSTVTAGLGTVLRADIINIWALRHIVLALTGAPARQIDFPKLYIVTVTFGHIAWGVQGVLITSLSQSH